MAIRVEILAGDNTSDPYLFWIGDGAKNDANAIFYVKKNGDSFYGGFLGDGPLRSTASSTVVGNHIQIQTGDFQTEGGVVDVSCSFSYSFVDVVPDMPSPITGPWGTLILERSVDGGPFSQVASKAITGEWDYAGYEPGLGHTYSIFAGADISYSGRVNGANTYNFRARFTGPFAWPRIGITSGYRGIQSFNLVTTEY